VSLVGLRAVALAAALVLAVLSRGDVFVLAGLLAVGAWRPLPAVAIASALAASAWRWGSTSLEDIAGAQAVLGPAGWVDPPSAAVGSWLGAAAIVLACSAPPGRWGRVVAALAAGAAAAAVVAGPAPGGALWARAVVGALAALAAHLVSGLRGGGGRRAAALDGLAIASGAGALALVGLDAPAWEGGFDAAALREGVLVATAAGLIVATAGGVGAARRSPGDHPR